MLTLIGRLHTMNFWNNWKRKYVIIAVIVLVGSTLIATFAYRTATTVHFTPTATHIAKKPTIVITPTTQPTPSPTPSPTPLPLGPILGLESDLTTSHAGIPWVRFGYRSCGANSSGGDALKASIEAEHMKGVRVLVTTCQLNGSALYSVNPLNDIAQSGAD